MDKIGGFVDADVKSDVNYRLNSINCLSYKELLKVKNMDVVICSFDRKQEIISELKLVDKSNKIYSPICSSSINNLFFEFNNNKYLTKCFWIEEVVQGE